MRKMPEQHERHIQYKIDKKHTYEEKVWKGVFSNASVWGLDVEKLFDSPLIHDHLRYVFVLILTSNV